MGVSNTGQAPAAGSWTGSGPFDDTAWQQGISPLGNDGEQTVVSYGPSAANKYITTYFRKTIAITRVCGAFGLRYKRDDGIVIYVNGTKLLREYMPAGTLTNSTSATIMPEAQEPLWKTVAVPASILRSGTNVIAAKVHQTSPTSDSIWSCLGPYSRA